MNKLCPVDALCQCNADSGDTSTVTERVVPDRVGNLLSLMII